MPTPSGHTRAILASKVQGTPVYNRSGDRLGAIEDVVLDKMSNSVLFAVLGSGGILGAGEKYRPVPWSLLNYSDDKDGYVLPFGDDVLNKAPAYRMEDLTADDGTARSTVDQYYSDVRIAGAR